MEYFSKYLSVVLHPVLLPTLACFTYFILDPLNYSASQQYLVLGFVFIGSYILPLLLLFFFKHINLISDLDIRKAKERKIPLITFMSIDFIQALVIYNIPNLQMLSVIFWGSLGALIITYLLLSINFKASLHLMGISGFTSFIVMLSLYYSINLIPLIILLIILSGFLATARLVLKAHTPLELLVGFICGSGSVLVAWLILL